MKIKRCPCGSEDFLVRAIEYASWHVDGQGRWRKTVAVRDSHMLVSDIVECKNPTCTMTWHCWGAIPEVEVEEERQ